MIKYLDTITTTFPIEATPRRYPRNSADHHLHCRFINFNRDNHSDIFWWHSAISIPRRPHNCILHSPARSGLYEKWFQKWGFKINENKSTRVTFTLRRQTCPRVTINNITIPNQDSVRYLDMTLDRRLTWKQHIVDKSKQLRDKLKTF